MIALTKCGLNDPATVILRWFRRMRLPWFEEVRRWMEGRVYGSIEEKMAAVDKCLSRLESDPERVKSLVSWEWIRQNVQELSEDYAASSN